MRKIDDALETGRYLTLIAREAATLNDSEARVLLMHALVEATDALVRLVTKGTPHV